MPPVMTKVSRRAGWLVIVCQALLWPGALRAADCNLNGQEDAEEIASGASPDCNANEIPDVCDVRPTRLSFALERRYVTGPGAQYLASGDIDGDGRVDLLVTKSRAASLSLLLSAGGGRFRDPRILDVGAGAPRFPALADLTGDGLADLVLVDFGFSAVAVMPGAGAAGFGSPVRFPASDDSRRFAVADLDADSDLDLAVPFLSINQVAVFANDGTGRLVRGKPLDVQRYPVAIEALDADLDGDLDQVVGYAREPAVAVLQNVGSGAFVAGPSLQLGPFVGEVRDVRALDLEGDGYADFAVSVNFDVLLLRNEAGAALRLADTIHPAGHPNAIATGDVSGDGAVDLITAGGSNPGFATLFHKDADGTLQKLRDVTIDSEAEGLLVADFDDDSRLDIVVTAGFDGTSVYLHSPVDPQRDCDRNEIPDECQAQEGDCDANGTLDVCELAGRDCDASGGIDACEIASLRTPDCDADGIPDACQAAPLLGFGAPLSLASPNGPTSIDAGDFDGDGDADLVATEIASGGVSLHFNGGFGQQWSRQSKGTNVSPRHVVAADLDGDERPDLAMLEESGAFATLRNDGAGGFAPLQYLPAGRNRMGTRHLLAADLDGDDDLDLAVASAESRNIELLLNDGRGSVAASAALTLAGAAASVAVADLNHDGSLDLAASTHAAGARGSVVLFTGDRGTFSPGGSIPAGTQPARALAVDVDGDAALDLLVGDDADTNVRAYENDGLGTFAARDPVTVPFSAGLLESADFDDDGTNDLAALGQVAERLRVATHRAGFEFVVAADTRTGGIPRGIIAHDVTADGAPDLVVAAANDNAIHIHRNLGHGFDVPFHHSIGRSPVGIATGDLDGDGDVDVVGVNREGRTGLLANQGQGRFLPLPETFVEFGASGISPADLDRDGDLDLIVAHDLRVSLLVNGERGMSWSSKSVSVEGRPAAAAGGDLDGDGDLDLAVTFYDGGLRWYRESGGLSFTMVAGYATAGPDPVLPQHLEIADVDADSLADVVVAVPIARSVAVLLNQGAGQLAGATVFGGGGYTAAVVDVDGDMDPDVVSQSIDTGPGRGVVLLNDGAGAFPATIPWTTKLGGPAAAGDLDGDGDIDLACAHWVSGDVSIVANLGQRLIVAAGVYATGKHPVALALRDLDADGDADLVSANEGNETVSVTLARARLQPGERETYFHRGDATGEGGLDVSDAIRILDFLFVCGLPPRCLDAADANDDERIDLSDGVFVLRYLFLGMAPPPAPGPPGSPCGPDPQGTAGQGCSAYTGC